MANQVKKVYPFAASLFGWSNFLKMCLTDNAYLDSFDIANVFNYKATTEQFNKILYNSAYRANMQDRMERFAERYHKIASPEDVLNNILLK